MVQRSTSQLKIDKNAFPVVIRVLLPERGMISLGLDNNPDHWLLENVGAGNFAVTPHHSRRGDGVAINLRSVEDALAFVRRFPMLKLSDETMIMSYPSAYGEEAEWETDLMCNLNSMTKSQDAVRNLFPKPPIDRLGNLEEMPGIYPDYHAPIIREGVEGREMVMGRWGMPSPEFALQNKKTDRGVTNVRNTKSPHWRRWLGPENRCLVPLTRFAEPDVNAGIRSNVWFALTDDQPAFFAGIWTRWTSVRKLRDGETRDDLYAFLTTNPNAEVARVHPKAMPVILTEPDDWEKWLTAPWSEVANLQRPLADGAFKRVEA